MRHLLTILIFICIHVSLFAQSRAYDQGMNALRNREDQQALEYLQKSADEGFLSFDLFYNLGTLYLKAENPAKARLYFEKALKIEPRNGELLQNIEYLDSTYPSDIRAIPSFFISRWFQNISKYLSSNQWFTISLILMVFMVYAFYQWLLGRGMQNRKWGFTSFLASLFLLALTTGFSFCKKYLETNTDFAIQMENRVGLYQGPDQKSERLLLLQGGEKVRLLDTYGEWTQVELEDREVGWLESRTLESI